MSTLVWSIDDPHQVHRGALITPERAKRDEWLVAAVLRMRSQFCGPEIRIHARRRPAPRHCHSARRDKGPVGWDRLCSKPATRVPFRTEYRNYQEPERLPSISAVQGVPPCDMHPFLHAFVHRCEPLLTQRVAPTGPGQAVVVLALP
jgi:hypothetical protein